MRGLPGHARSAIEREKKQARRVERGEERAQQEQAPDRSVAAVERGREDLVLREEAREHRHTGEPEASDRRGDRRGHHPRRQPTHLANVLLAAETVDNAPCAEEEERLEEGV